MWWECLRLTCWQASVNDLKTDPLKIDEVYTTAIAKCFNLVTESFQYTGSVRSSIGVVTAALLLNMEELLEVATLRITQKLCTGVLDQPSLQLLMGTREQVQINLHRLLLQATGQTADALHNLSKSELFRGKEACELQLLDIWISDQVIPCLLQQRHVVPQLLSTFLRRNSLRHADNHLHRSSTRP